MSNICYYEVLILQSCNALLIPPLERQEKGLIDGVRVDLGENSREFAAQNALEKQATAD